MTLNHINNVLYEMKEVAQKDPEAFHSLQDKLYKDLLTYFSNTKLGPHHVNELAQAALKTEEIETKWFARS